MPQPHNSSLESTLLRNLAAAQKGDADASSRVYDTLKQLDPDRHADLFPTVRRLLTLNDPDVQMAAAIFIGSLREAAEPAVPDLVELAKKDEELKGPCVCSLVQIPGERSAQALADLFVSGAETDATEAYMILSALRSRASDMVEHLPRIEVAANRFGGESADVVNDFLNDVRRARPSVPEWQLSDVEFGSRVTLLPQGFEEVEPDEHFGPHRVELAEGSGLVYEGRLPFEVSVEGLRGEVGLRVYRTNRADPQHVVVISADEDWYGASPQDYYEYLATACVHMCGLDPKSTAWIERWTASTGMNQTAADELSLVSMRFDPKTRGMHSPQWRRIDSLPEYLKDVGAAE